MRSSAKNAPRPVAASRPRDPPSFDRFAGDHRGRVTTRTRVLVVHPRHLARTGVHVGRGDVAIGPDHELDRREVGPAQAFELRHRETLRIDLDAAFRASERDVEQRGLPRHQGREAPELVPRGVRMEPQPALERTTRTVVLDPPPRVHVEGAVVAGNTNRHRHLPTVRRQDLACSVVEAKPLRGDVEMTLDRVEQTFRGDGVAGRVVRHTLESFMRWTCTCRSRSLRPGTSDCSPADTPLRCA